MRGMVVEIGMTKLCRHPIMPVQRLVNVDNGELKLVIKKGMAECEKNDHCKQRDYRRNYGKRKAKELTYIMEMELNYIEEQLVGGWMGRHMVSMDWSREPYFQR